MDLFNWRGYISSSHTTLVEILLLQKFHQRKAMEQSVILVIMVQIILIAYGSQVGTSNQLEIETILQYNPTEQGERTAYHFQPPRNWMNGSFFIFMSLFVAISLDFLFTFILTVGDFYTCLCYFDILICSCADFGHLAFYYWQK